MSNYQICSANKNVDKGRYTDERFRKLLENLNLDDLDDANRHELLKILKRYQSTFHIGEEDLTTNNFYRQNINLHDTNPVYIKNYRLPHTHTQEINSQVQELLESNIIEPSISPYNNPYFYFQKWGRLN